jgi:hypothetical protein
MGTGEKREEREGEFIHLASVPNSILTLGSILQCTLHNGS